MPDLAPSQTFLGYSEQWAARLKAASMPALLGFALLAFSWLLPGNYLPWVKFQQESLAGLGGLLLCWAALEKSSGVTWPAAAGAALVVAVVPWLQYFGHEIRFLTDALLSSLYLVALAISIAAGATMARGPQRNQLLDGWAACCVFVSLASTGMALYQWLQLPPLGDWLSQVVPGGRVFANLGQPNHLASVLALGIAGVLRWYETGRIERWSAALAAVFILWGLAMTESRTGWMFIGICGLGTILLHRRAQLRTSPTAVVAATVVFAVFVLAESRLHTAWTQAAVVGELRTQAGTRITHWATLLDAALRSPWVGYGWNQVAEAQYSTVLAHPATGEALMHSHNLLIDLVIYNGVPLGAALFVALCWWVLRALKGCRHADAWYLMAGLLALLVHALVEYPLHYLYFLIPAGFLMGALTVLASDRGMHRERSRATLWAPALIMLVALVWVGVEYVRAEEALRRLRFASARIGITMADLRTPDLVLLDGWKAYHEAARIKPDSGMSRDQMKLLSDVAQRFPYPAALNRLAQALVLNAEPAAAVDVLSHLCKTYTKPVQDLMGEAWQEQQARDPRLRSVDFPRCE
jgi:O-antigen ligase